MAEVNQTSQRQCDRCGAQSDPAPKGTAREGWLTGLGLHAQGAPGVLDDLCPGCAGLPVAQAVVPVPGEQAA